MKHVLKVCSMVLMLTALAPMHAARTSSYRLEYLHPKSISKSVYNQLVCHPLRSTTLIALAGVATYLGVDKTAREKVLIKLGLLKKEVKNSCMLCPCSNN